jgi:hypothetical protein
MKPTRHAIARASERHGVEGTRRNWGRNITKAVKEAMATGVVASNLANPWEAEVVHPDGRRWIVDLRTDRVITALPRLNTTRKEDER